MAHTNSHTPGNFSESRTAVQTGVHDMMDQGREIVGSARTTARNALKGLQKDASAKTEELTEMISERPLIAMAIAAGAGALLAMYLMRRR